MATRLDVVNDCLAIMGEAPLNALTEDHSFKQAALNVLTRNDRAIQNEGWWYNTENLALLRNPADERVYLPTDGSTIRPDTSMGHRYVQRGRVLYDLEKGTDRFPEGFTLKVKLVRQVAYEDTPSSVNSLIGRKTVLDFQQEFDGDQTKTRNLLIEVYGDGGRILGLRGAAEAEHIRSVDFNFIHNSERLARITNRINYSRRPR